MKYSLLQIGNKPVNISGMGTFMVITEQYIEQLLAGFKSGNRYSLSRLITLLENDDISASDIRNRLNFHLPGALRIGITGSGGVGKSSLINCLISIIRDKGLEVGVIAVDPSSSFTGGALLGDRIRMQQHNDDEGVFVRSAASRGSLGGLLKSIDGMADLLDAFGFKTILIETTGAGQTEVDISNVADITILVLVAGYGDEIQLMKAGQLEIADIIVINKADCDGAEDLAGKIEELFLLSRNSEPPPVIMTQSINNVGMEEVYAQIEKQRNKAKSPERKGPS